ncbi:MAG: 50S ribosomal protein L32 [Erysipelotrichaceae bacterium]|jgi:large subunit ribosomal protein L32|nr:50S ribosomal protein L32 [Erysipelotrichaceae bacterium]
MAVPQRRISKTRKRLRRTHFKLAVEGLVTCPNCGELIKAHHVCPKCGYYAGKVSYLNGKVVTKTEVKKEENAGKKSSRKAKKEAK